MPAEATLAVRCRVAHRSGDAPAFTLDVAFEAPPGITILFGPSGSGKTTTLAAIAGLVRPEAGRIALGDEAWFDAERRIDRPTHLRGVALVFQRGALFPHMSVLANVEYGVSRALGSRERRRHALAMLERMKVAHLAARRPRTLSGGEAQRVALARSFAMQPRVMLLDEAFSAMDRALRRELLGDVRRYVDETRLPLLQVTHQVDEARALGDRVVCLEGGRVRAVGPADELLPTLAGP